MAIPVLRRLSTTENEATAPSGRPSLEVVRNDRRRWPALLGAMVMAIMMVAMLAAAVFHTQLAERQLRVDELEQMVDDERVRFDELRRDRAVLRSPERIAAEANDLGMVPSDSIRFLEIDPQLLAIQLAAAGATDDRTRPVTEDFGPLDQFRDVKAVSEGQP